MTLQRSFGTVKRKKKVFISFDYDNDKHYKFLLGAWDANKNFDFVFKDETPGEINTNNIARIKAGLTSKIKDAEYTLFIVGAHANERHKDHKLIGFTNWINFEAYQSIQFDNKLAVVKIDKAYSVPKELEGSGYWYLSGFEEKNVIKLLNHK